MNNQNQRQVMYGASRAISAELLSSGLITQQEYRKLDTMMRKRYRPVIYGPEKNSTHQPR